jgi:hypothetical protein
VRIERQSADDLFGALSELPVAWADDHATKVMALTQRWGALDELTEEALSSAVLDDRAVARTTCRLLLDLSKDEFDPLLAETVRSTRPNGPRGPVTSGELVHALMRLGVTEAFRRERHRMLLWDDRLIERLKSGRGSAIRGQRRGRVLEDFVESIVRRVFGQGGYEARVQFTGRSEALSSKADFAIPSASTPAILIEVKAYGATGSKQSDVLGDVQRIVDAKRSDTRLLLVTDGLTWRARAADLRKLVDLQHQGSIARIYPQRMSEQLEHDLADLGRSYQLLPPGR